MIKKINFWRPLLLILILGIVSCSRQEPKNYTIGIINLNSNLDGIIYSLKKGLAERGYKPGVNTTYLYSGSLKNPKLIDQEVKNMLKTGVDLIITMTTPATKKLKEMPEVSHLPILFVPVFSPESSGLVDSIAAPGGHLTGIKTRGSTGKTLEWFLKISPTAKRIFVPFHHTDTAAIETLEDLEVAANFFNLELIIRNLSTEQELKEVLADIPVGTDALWMTHSHLIVSNINKIITAANALRIPTISSTGQTKKGAMVCYAPSHEKLGRQASRMADKILKGADPATLPVETADYFLGLNLVTAKAIGLKIPADIISQADIVIR